MVRVREYRNPAVIRYRTVIDCKGKYISHCQSIIAHLTPLARPLAVPLPVPVPILEPPLADGACKLPLELPAVLLDLFRPYPELDAPVLPTARPLPLVPLVPPLTVVPACLCLSSSSALRLASSRLLSSSAALLSAAWTFRTCSFSISATS